MLKDSWVDAGRKREGEILALIREEAKKLRNAYDFDKYFIQAMDYGDVYIGDSMDHTHDLIRGKASLAGLGDKPLGPLVIKARKAAAPKSKGPNLLSNITGVTGAPRLPNDGPPDLMRYSAKVHHRVVFAEVGKTIAEVDSLSDAIFAMSDVVKGECAIFSDNSPSLTRGRRA